MRVSVPTTKKLLLAVVTVQILIFTFFVHQLSQGISQLVYTAVVQPKVKTGLSIGVGCEQEINDKDHAPVRTGPFESNHTRDPLEDFKRYPCVQGIPMFPARNQSIVGKCVRTFCFSEDRNKTTKNCVPLRTPRGNTTICTYPVSKDIHVSGSIHRNGQWEGGQVKQLADIFITLPDLEFLDLGCNIGTYTLALAHQGVKVTAIDPMLENLELLSQSLKLGNLQENVTLIWNAVSNKRQIITFKDDRNNVGGTQIQDANVTNSHDYMARTILLDDLLPLFRGKQVVIKMDIESSEYLALLGGSRFFDEVTVVVLQIEMLLTKSGPHGIKIVDLLSSKGYHPFKDICRQHPLHPKSIKSWPNDIYFSKTTQQNKDSMIVEIKRNRRFRVPPVTSPKSHLKV